MDGETFEAATGVVLNTGTRPATPPIDGLADTPFWTNRDVLRIDTLPSTLGVIGGGPIGAELAQALARFGVRVTVIEAGPHLLGPVEPEAGALVADVFGREGIQVLDGATISRVSYDDGQFTVAVDGQELTFEKLLVAAGRTPNLDDVGLDTVGLDPSARSIEVDDRMRAGDGLWAIGDIVGHGAFTHLSMYQSAIAVASVLGKDGPAADYRAVPHVTFTDPEVGGVGMTEKQARDAGLTVRVGTTDLSASTRGWIAQADGPDQAGRGRRPRRAGRGDGRRSGRRRDPRDAGHRGARGGADRDAAHDDLCLPDPAPGARDGACRPLLGDPGQDPSYGLETPRHVVVGGRPVADRHPQDAPAVPGRAGHPRRAVRQQAVDHGVGAGVVAEVRAHLREHDVVADGGTEVGQTVGEGRRMTTEAVDQVGDPGAAE